MHMRRRPSDHDDEEETVHTFRNAFRNAYLEGWHKGQRAKGNQSPEASSVVGSVLGFFLCRHFGRGFTFYPFLSSSPQSFALGLQLLLGTLFVPFSFSCFNDISWTLMTQIKYCNEPLFLSLATPTPTHTSHITSHSLLTLHTVLYLGYPSMRKTRTR